MEQKTLEVGQRFERDDFNIKIEKIYYFTTEPNVFYTKVTVEREYKKPVSTGFITCGRPNLLGLNKFICKFLPETLAKADDIPAGP